MSSESVCQVAHSWVDVGSFFEVVYVTCGYFHDGSEKGTSVHQILCQSWEKCYGDPHNDSTSLRGPTFLVMHMCYNSMPASRPVAHQLTMTNTQGDTEAAQLLKLSHEFKSSSLRIDVGPFTTLLRRWELIMGHANGFWRKNLECAMSQPNLCPRSWQLTRSSSTSSALNFVSSPPMMKPSCPGSSLVMRAEFTVTTLRQSNDPPSGKASRHQGQERPDRWKLMSTPWSSLCLTWKGLCTKNQHQQAKLWIPGSTATFCGDCVKTCEDVAPKFGENRPGCFTMTTPRLTRPSSPTSFRRKTKWLSFPNPILPWTGTLWLLPISKNKIEAERTPVWYHWGDTGRIAESAWHSERKGLPGSIPEMEETVGPVSTCGRELLRWWWRPLGLMVSFTIFTVSVRKILDTTLYIYMHVYTHTHKLFTHVRVRRYTCVFGCVYVRITKW